MGVKSCSTFHPPPCTGDLRCVHSFPCCGHFVFNLKVANGQVICTSETNRAEPSHDGGIAGWPDRTTRKSPISNGSR